MNIDEYVFIKLYKKVINIKKINYNKFSKYTFFYDNKFNCPEHSYFSFVTALICAYLKMSIVIISTLTI